MASKVVKYGCPTMKAARALWGDLFFLNVFQFQMVKVKRKPVIIVTYAEGATQVREERLKALDIKVVE